MIACDFHMGLINNEHAEKKNDREKKKLLLL